MDDNLQTLPDYLAPGLALVLVGINPSRYSAEVGRYFANPRNRFWRAFNAAGLTPEPLSAETDHRALEFGIGFTDLVKRPTPGIAELRPEEYRQGAALLREKLDCYRPRIVCFNGITAFDRYLRHTEGGRQRVALGLQPHTIGESLVFVAPNPSPANAAFSLDALVCWYRKLKELRDGLC